jgi:hypothetical protein
MTKVRMTKGRKTKGRMTKGRMTIDLIDVFCRQSIIGIDPINVFFTIGAQLCYSMHMV